MTTPAKTLSTATPRHLSVADIAREEPVVNTANCSGGVEYSDAYLHDNDARFVFRFIRLALDQGCVAANYVECIDATRDPQGRWRVEAVDRETGAPLTLCARVVINATGAFVDDLNKRSGIDTRYRHVLSKGIHLVVPRITASNRVLAFFADDGRLFFAIPMAHRTCIGTTDTRVDQTATRVTAADREFVLANINKRLALPAPLTSEDIISERCGVRPLAVQKGRDSDADFLQLSRKHMIETSAGMSHISIFGGKLTDCLNVGDEICDHVSALGVTLDNTVKNWYGSESAQEQELYREKVDKLGFKLHSAEDTGEPLATRLWRRYGPEALSLLERIEADPLQAEPVLEGTGIRRCELEFLRDREMIVRFEDFLRRRSKIELLYGKTAIARMRGLEDSAAVLFGQDANDRLREYLADDSTINKRETA